jgi:hypothetical protein
MVIYVLSGNIKTERVTASGERQAGSVFCKVSVEY